MAPDLCMTVGSSSYVTGLFLVPVAAARAVVPDDYFTVAEVFPGRAVFFIGSGEFRDSDIGPYNELYIGFYTENRERGPSSNMARNAAELVRNRSRMFMWKNWLSSGTALERMDEAGAELFRLGDVRREDHDGRVTMSMEHDTEGAIRYTVPHQSRHTKRGFSLTKTHYGRLHGVPSRLQLDLDIEHMVTHPRLGELDMQGAVAEECAALGVLDAKPLASVWIEEMGFDMHKPVAL